MMPSSSSEETPNCGEWRLVREIGHGAYGTVFIAQKQDGECAALKVCRCDGVGEECFLLELPGAELYGMIPPQDGLNAILQEVNEVENKLTNVKKDLGN